MSPPTHKTFCMLRYQIKYGESNGRNSRFSALSTMSHPTYHPLSSPRSPRSNIYPHSPLTRPHPRLLYKPPKHHLRLLPRNLRLHLDHNPNPLSASPPTPFPAPFPHMPPHLPRSKRVLLHIQHVSILRHRGLIPALAQMAQFDRPPQSPASAKSARCDTVP
jgi:hypothetical protein